MLSSIIHSGLALSALRHSSSVSTSTSTASFGNALRAATTAWSSALGSPPRQSLRWLSFIRTLSYIPMRWFDPPPQRTAYFSNTRRPGVVLRVSRIIVPRRLTASTNLRVSVAVAHILCMKLRAVRSAARMLLALPRNMSIGSPGATTSPSRLRIRTVVFGSTAFMTARATVVPETTHPAPLACISPVATAEGSTSASLVASSHLSRRTSRASARSSSRAARTAALAREESMTSFTSAAPFVRRTSGIPSGSRASPRGRR